MKYTIMEFENEIGSQIKNKEGKPYFFNSMEEANIDRIYLQPDYENLLKVINYTKRS